MISYSVGNPLPLVSASHTHNDRILLSSYARCHRNRRSNHLIWLASWMEGDPFPVDLILSMCYSEADI